MNHTLSSSRRRPRRSIIKRVLNEARLRNKLEKLDNEVGTPVATMAPRHVERLNALAGTVGRNVVVPFMLLLRLASFFR